MTEPLPPLPEPAGLLQHDLPCIDCEYNLRMQPLDGRCPECGLAIEESLRKLHLLRYPGEWFSAKIRGAWLLIAALSVFLFGYFFGGVLGSLVARVSGSLGESFFALVFGGITLSIAILLNAGVFNATKRWTNQQEWMTTTARVMAAIFGITMALFALMIVISFRSPGREFDNLAPILMFGLGALGPLAVILGFWFGRIARIVNRHTLGTVLRSCGVVIVCTFQPVWLFGTFLTMCATWFETITFRAPPVIENIVGGLLAICVAASAAAFVVAAIALGILTFRLRVHRKIAVEIAAQVASVAQNGVTLPG